MNNLVGRNVFVRTVTFFYTGRLVAVADGFLELAGAAWVADTVRWADTLAKGTLAEVEPYPGTCYVALSAVVDVCEWLHPLPREQK